MGSFLHGEKDERTGYHVSHGNKDFSQAKEELQRAGHEFHGGKMYDRVKRKPFEFNVYSRHSDNQSRYEALGKIVEKYIYGLLQDAEEGAGLAKKYIPFDSRKEEGSFIFHSRDIHKKKQILILMHGSGVVRAGQWSRRLIMNNSLEAGSMIPYIKTAHNFGYGVIVLNTNQHSDYRYNCYTRSPEHHFEYVWTNLVEKLDANVAIVTHSYGGSVVMETAKKNANFMDRTFAVALTDCWVSDSMRLQSWLNEKVCNWVTSNQPIGSNVRSHSNCPTVSGGTTVHEETPWKAFESIWCFLCDRLDTKQAHQLRYFALAGTRTDVSTKGQSPKPIRKTSVADVTSSHLQSTSDRSYIDVPVTSAHSPKGEKSSIASEGSKTDEVTSSRSESSSKLRRSSSYGNVSVTSKRSPKVEKSKVVRRGSVTDLTPPYSQVTSNLRRTNSYGNVSVSSEKPTAAVPKVKRRNSFSLAIDRRSCDKYPETSTINTGSKRFLQNMRTGPLDLLGGVKSFSDILKKTSRKDKERQKNQKSSSRVTPSTYPGLHTPYATSKY